MTLEEKIRKHIDDMLKQQLHDVDLRFMKGYIYKPKYDPGKLAEDMVLVPFLYNPDTNQMEETYCTKQK